MCQLEGSSVSFPLPVVLPIDLSIYILFCLFSFFYFEQGALSFPGSPLEVFCVCIFYIWPVAEGLVGLGPEISWPTNIHVSTYILGEPGNGRMMQCFQDWEVRYYRYTFLAYIPSSLPDDRWVTAPLTLTPMQDRLETGLLARPLGREK